MKRMLISLALVAAPVLAQAQVGVSINIGEPGFFGQIDLGNRPPPPVVYSAPVIVEQQREAYPPIYLRVPEEHHRNWRKYCHQYNACNRQVYFVTEDWYNNSYAQERRHEHEHEHDEHHHEHDDDHHGHGNDQDEHHHDHDHDDGRN
jgi:hypothetical protein